MENENPNVFSIPSWNIHKLEKKIASMNRRAVKLDCPPISMNIIGEKQVPAPGYEELLETHGADFCPKITVYEVEIIGEGPKIEGWKFVGTLDHYSLPGSVLVNTVPGETVPSEFYNHEATCDHCGKIRRRTETFVLENIEDGHHTQVGRQCVKDFIGHDPKAVASYLRSLRRLIDNMGDEDEWWGGGEGRAVYTYEPMRVLKITAAIIRKYGWVPRSTNDYEARPTANEVLYAMHPPFGYEERKDWNKWVDSLDIENERFVEEAKAAREWLRTHEGADNEYMHNLLAIDKADVVPERGIGFWCSLIATYQRAMERLRLAESAKKLNEWVGEVKERLEFEVDVVSIRYHDGYYGTVAIHKMLDPEGRTLMWFANTNSGMEKGQKYRIKGTVKKHDVYKDWKQTVLSRVKVLAEIIEERVDD